MLTDEQLAEILLKNRLISEKGLRNARERLKNFEKESLEESLKKVKEYISLLPKMGASDNSKVYNTNLIEFLEFKNMLELSRLVLKGALSRQESRGAHYRSDFEYEDKKFEMHTIVDKDGVVK